MSTPDRPTTDGTDAPEARTDATLADQVFDDTTRTMPTTAAAPTAADAGTTWAPAPAATATAVREEPLPAGPPPREFVKGPAPFAIILGLLGLVVAATTLFTEIVGIDVPWGDLGPWTVVGGGALVLLVGALGLRSSRGQD